MWNNVVGRHIRRTNRNLFLANALLLAGVVATVGVGWNYWYNFLLGPFWMDRADVAALTRNQLDRLDRQYVTVDGQKVIPTTVTDVRRQLDKYTKREISSEVTARYSFLVVDDKLLLVKHAPNDTVGTHCSGWLQAAPDDVRTGIIIKAIAEEPALNGVILPALLYANGSRIGGYAGLAGLALVGLFAGWNLSKAVGRTNRPDRHPAARALLRYGVPDDVAAAIGAEADDRAECAEFNGATLTKSWLLLPSRFGLAVKHLGDTVWTFKAVTKHSYNGIPTGKTYAAVYCDRHGGRRSIPVRTEQQAEELVLAIVRRVPWTLAGYTPELEQHWNSRRAALVAAVDERRQQLIGGAEARTDGA
jgi:hypothetical protein